MSTTDVILTFLGDLDNEPDFFFPDIETDAFIADFERDSHSPSKSISSHLKLNDNFFSYDHLNSPISDDDYTIKTVPASSSSDSDMVSAENSESDESPVFAENKLKRKREPKTALIKTKKKKLTIEEKIFSLVSILRKMRKNIPTNINNDQMKSNLNTSFVAESSRTYGLYEKSIEEAYNTAENFLNTIFSGKSCQPDLVSNSVELTGSLFVPALSSLFNLTQKKKSQKNLSAWAPYNKSLDTFPEKHTGIGQIAAASRCFSRILSDLLPDITVDSSAIEVKIKKSAMASGNQLIAPFFWKCSNKIDSKKLIEFSGLIRCTFGQSKISFVHISFDAFTILRQCE